MSIVQSPLPQWGERARVKGAERLCPGINFTSRPTLFTDGRDLVGMKRYESING